MKALSTEKTMTVKEVSEILKCDPDTVRRHIKKEWPEIIQNGKTTYLNESQVTYVKMKIERSGRNDLLNVAEVPQTSLEKKMIVQQAMMILHEEIEELRYENSMLKPKAELAELALRDDSKHYSIRDAGKHLELRQSEIFSLLRDKGLLTIKNLPTQKAIDYNVLTLRTNLVGEKNRPQSVMTMQNIDNLRKRYLKKKELTQ